MLVGKLWRDFYLIFKEQIGKTIMDTESPVVWPSWCYSGETTASSPAEILDATTQLQNTNKLLRKRRMERPNSVGSGNGVSGNINNNLNGLISDCSIHNISNNNNNNNNSVKNERLSPGNTDVSSRSRSVTPSSASHPGTPPSSENHPLNTPTRNYSDFMRSLAARYNNTNPNDYFSAARNGFPPPIDPRFKPNFPTNLLPALPKDPIIDPINNNNNNNNNSNCSSSSSSKKPDLTTLINPYSAIFPPPFEMTSTHALIAMIRTAKEAEIQNLLKNAKRQDPSSSSTSSSPLDLSSAAGSPPAKRPKIKTITTTSSGGSFICNPSTITTTQTATTTTTTTTTTKRAESASPHLQEDISNWTVDDVCNFVSSIDICAEYSQNFRAQQIDGSGLPLLTEEHLISTMQMKLGPALKLRSILAKKLGSCNICLHCNHCHNSTGSPEPAIGGNTSDSGGVS